MEKTATDFDEFLLLELEKKSENELKMLKNLELQKRNLLKLWDAIPSHLKTQHEVVPESNLAVPDTALDHLHTAREKPTRKCKLGLITPSEFASIPSYVVGRTTLEKLNASIKDLNMYLADKNKVLAIPEAKMKQLQRDVLYDFKTAQTAETKGYFFVTEKELKANSKGNSGWTKSKFNYGAQCRNTLTILRTLGKIREVRGTGHTRFVVV
ncbi:Spindle and kinetochore-associated protein 1 [Kappamyces sp. JEL0829]|nr:Spindle and kinetochore-associated protein 1 [Kappamyces sp. JEL0829]